MSVDLYRLDPIEDYDEAIVVLEDYVADLVEEFIQAPEGEAYLETYPAMQAHVGHWIDTLIHFGYAYDQPVALPYMTPDHVEEIVTGLFTRKASLPNPDETDAAIPELLAFWTFLKRVYQHPHASQVLTCLKRIQPQFKQMMTAPEHFGVAKSFFIAGHQAEEDMLPEEGRQAVQPQSNQTLQSSTSNSPMAPDAVQSDDMTPLGGDVSSEQADSAKLQNFVSALLGAMSQGSLQIGGSGSLGDFEEELVTLSQTASPKSRSLPKTAIAVLKQQQITESQPGSILKDFQTLLDFIGDEGIVVSGKYCLIPLKRLSDLNQRLSVPIELDLKRPTQKSYSPINGLYLLLRASGIGQIVNRGKKKLLTLQPELLKSWRSLNSTERYCTLLEAWLIRGHGEMLGERRSVHNAGSKCIQYWSHISNQDKAFSSYSDQHTLSYWPELHNLALMSLFGFLQVESGKPEAGKGWRIRRVKKLPFGDALMQAIIHAYTEQGMIWESEDDPTIPFGELQPALQPYFPAWRNTLAVPAQAFRPGVYVFKVSLGKIWRRIALSSDMTLADLSGMILDAVDFDSDHLDMFRYKNHLGRTVEATHPYADGYPCTNDVQLGDLPLAEGASMTYIFDFGDWWEFDVQLEKVEADRSRQNYEAILEGHGEPPLQYPNWDDWDEED